jgi:hypothetical protein
MATQVEDLVLLRVDEECAKLQADVSLLLTQSQNRLAYMPSGGRDVISRLWIIWSGRLFSDDASMETTGIVPRYNF